MEQDKLKALVAGLAKDIKTERDLGALTQQPIKPTVETALNAKLDEHLGYDKHDPAGRGSGNSPTAKRLKGQHGEVPLETPHDSNRPFARSSCVRARPGQPRWTIRSWPCMPRA